MKTDSLSIPTNPAGFKTWRNKLQARMYRRQLLSRERSSVGAFAYDLSKILVKEAVWLLSPGMQSAACMLLGRLGLVNRSYLAFIKAGSPKTVLSGPFSGTRFYPVPTGGEFFPKLLGTYEIELHPAIDAICGCPCDVIVDIGSAEGYYAVGLARRLRPGKVICYDGNPHARRLLLRNTRLNQVEKTVIAKRWCSTSELEADIQRASYPLIVCDCEGGEQELLDPHFVPSLRRSVILVEIHDRVSGGPISLSLRSRFAQTHAIQVIESRPRHLGDLPSGLSLSEEEAMDSMSEGRQVDMEWFLMIPRMETGEDTPNLQ